MRGTIKFYLTLFSLVVFTNITLYSQGTVIDLAQVSADLTVLSEAEDGHFGVTAVALDFNDDGFTDFAFGANRASAPPRTNPGQDRGLCGKVYLFYGGPSMPPLIDLRVENADVTFWNAGRQTYLGTALATGDVNNDGIDDLIMGTNQSKVSFNYAASVYVIYGREPSEAALLPAIWDFAVQPADVRIQNVTDFEGQQMGTYLASGDIDGDGIDDILMTAPKATVARGWGVIYVVFGSSALPSAIAVNESSSTWQLRFTGISWVTQSFGRGILAKDVNEDGIDDVIAVDLTTQTAYVMYGRSEFSATYLGGTYSLNGNPADLTFAWVDGAMAVGDINADGHLDLLFTKSSGSGGPHGVFVKYGGPFLTQTAYQFNPSQGNYTAPDVTLSTIAGSVAVGDVNGDGVEDILAGGSNQVVVAFSDPNFPPNHVIGYPGGLDIQIIGDEPGSKGSTIGSSLAGGDVNGDSGDDIIFGARYRDNGAFQEAGAGFIVNGSPVPVPVLISPADGSALNDNLPVFDWTDVTDPDGLTYTLQVDDDPSFSSPEIEVSGLNLSEFAALMPLADGHYYWRVRAEDGLGNIGSFTAAFSFQIVTECLDSPSGLTHWWPGDGHTLDVQGGVHGTLQNGSAFAPGRVDQALSFDAVDDCIDLNTKDLIGVGSYSISAWFKTGVGGNILSNVHSGGPTSYTLLSVRGDNGKLQFVMRGATLPQQTWITTASFADNQWHHAFATVDRTAGVKIYADGAEITNFDNVGAVQAGNVDNPFDTYHIGSNGECSGVFNGLIDELSIYDRALANSEVQAIFAAGSEGKCKDTPVITTPSLLGGFVGDAYAEILEAALGTAPYSFAQVLGTLPPGLTLFSDGQITGDLTAEGTFTFTAEVTDSQGKSSQKEYSITVLACADPPSGLVSWWQGDGNPDDIIGPNNGTLFGQTTFVSGKVGQAFSFDGANDYVDVGNDPSLDITNTITVGAWIKTSNNFQNGSLISKWTTGGGTNNSYVIAAGQNVANNNIGFTIQQNTGGFKAVYTSYEANVWTHIVGVADGQFVRLYKNGAEVSAPVAYDGTIKVTSKKLLIGKLRQEDSVNSFNGYIDEVSIYESALSSSEIQAIFDAGAAGKCKDFPPIIITQSLPDAVVGEEYLVHVEADRGTPAYSFSLASGALPPGLNLLPSGEISGTPTVGGTFNITVEVVDSEGESSQKDFSIRVVVCVEPPANLVAWWPMDETSGSIAEDIVGDKDGTLNGVSEPVTGFVSGARHFDAQGTLMAPGDGALNITGNQVTIDAWIKLEDNPSGNQVFNSIGKIVFPDKQAYQLFFENRPGWLPADQWSMGYVLTNSAGTKVGNQNTGVILTVDGQYHHFVLTYDGSNVRLYVDGVLTGTFSFSGNLKSLPAEPVYVFAQAPWSVDEVSIYDGALSSSEIQAMFDAGAAGKCKPPESPTDTTPPIITLNGDNPLSPECGTPYDELGAVVTDDFDPDPSLEITGTVNSNVLGEYMVTYTATDASGNTSSVNRIVNVADTTPPQITLVGANPLALECPNPYDEPGAEVSDICDPSPSLEISGGIEQVPGEYLITYTARDASGNSASATRTVVVADDNPPEITLLGDNPWTLQCNVDSYVEPGASVSDACDPAPTLEITGTVDTSVPGTYTVTYTATDGSGNSSSTLRTVNVVDTHVPVITLNGDNPLTLECHIDSYAELGATVTDVCDENPSLVITGSVDSETLGDYPITYTATDAQGNIATATRTVRVVDTLPPTITLNGDNPLSLECNVDTYEELGAQVSDACDPSPTLEITGVVDASAPGTYTVTYTATDESGNTDSITRTVEVIDTHVPVITLNGDNPLTLECRIDGYVELGATVTDVCDENPSLVITGSVDTETLGEYPITYTATDARGNTATANRTVRVIDTMPPTITLNGDNPLSLECSVDSYEEPGATVSDACDPSPTLEIIGTVDASVPGTCTVTYTATDASGNSASATRTVEVIDTHVPMITLNGENPITLECNIESYEEPGAVVSDLCDPNPILVITGSVDTGTVGEYSITYTATDIAGNNATAMRTVFVVDTTPPTITDITVAVDPIEVNTKINAGADLADACGAPHTAEWDWGDGSTSAGTVDESAGSVAGSHTYTSAGVYTVTLTLTDDHTNASVGTFQFVVIYDPSAGFVTGGGWIDSPPGAYVADPDLTGKANFGFVSKYKKGKSTPDGNTQFHFKAADFKFSSTSYDWLVIAGPNAKFKGLGTINQGGDYGFMLTARDGQVNGGGGVDRFRIKIWDRDGGDAVVYDNQMGESDDGDATDAIEGGSIVIHQSAAKLAGESDAIDDEIVIPKEFALRQNYPNPFNPETKIEFALPRPGHVELTIYNTRGQVVRRLVSQIYKAGEHSISWDGRDDGGKSVSSGVYLYEIQAGRSLDRLRTGPAAGSGQRFRQVKKMSLLK